MMAKSIEPEPMVTEASSVNEGEDMAKPNENVTPPPNLSNETILKSTIEPVMEVDAEITATKTSNNEDENKVVVDQLNLVDKKLDANIEEASTSVISNGNEKKEEQMRLPVTSEPTQVVELD